MVFFLFCILVDRPMGGGYSPPPPPGYDAGSNEKREDQKKKKVFVPKFPLILVVVSKLLRISTNSEVRTKKKRSSSQNLNEIRYKPTKITKKQFLLTNFRAINTNLGVLGLDLHSSSPEPVNFYRAQSSIGGAQFSFRGHGAGMPPVAPGLYHFIPTNPLLVTMRFFLFFLFFFFLNFVRSSPKPQSMEI